MNLSVGIITLNEEKNLDRTLQSVKAIADEIIIIDSGSTDKTFEIAQKHNAKFIFHKWEGFGKQKNFAIEQCSGEWILLIDADEVLSEELINRIKFIKENEIEKKVFKINRCSICFGKLLKHGGWSNQYAIRLWKKGAVMVNDNLVHEEFLTKEEIHKIPEKIYHYTYNTLDDYFVRFNKYTTLGAQEYFKRGKKASTLKIVFNPIYKFIKMYIIRLGCLDGIEGFTLACASAMYSMVKYFKLREMYKTGAYSDTSGQ
ncbi:MAG: glycosyltransferase family 2 protein [Bacteroidota bacterium]|nr:glycosyltransferase family 2 protein [Bacteroidota bacterium]